MITTTTKIAPVVDDYAEEFWTDCARHWKESTQKRFLSDIVQRVFDGSSSQLVLQALGGQPQASREELDEIKTGGALGPRQRRPTHQDQG